MKRSIFTVLITFFFCNTILAQEPILYLNFDKEKGASEYVKNEEAVYMIDLLQSQYAKGIIGNSLDLSENATLRKPVKLGKEDLDYAKNNALTVQVWVKTIGHAKMGTPIIGNKKSGDLKGKGWQIFSKENGAWALNLSDSIHQYDYQPTVKRQSINDGEWHQLLFSVNREKEEVWMYFDGRNVAIYNTPNLKGFESTLSTVIGGSDEKWEWGSYGQWNSFNGYIDEVKIWDRYLNSTQVKELYEKTSSMELPNDEVVRGQIKVLAWNIWHGGHRYGEQVGVQRVIDVIDATNADVIGLIETYGSGEILADALGYYFYLISSNLSILSKYPITETIQVFKPFNFGGAKLKLNEKQDLVFLDTWLHYLPNYSDSISKHGHTKEELFAAEGKTRHSEINDILKGIKPWLSNAEETPIVMSGDFNIGSHLDWIESTRGMHYDRIIDWPESKEMAKVGFIDSYRELHINPLLDPGFTWTPRAATSSDKYGLRDRIDYIYYQGSSLRAIESKVIDYHPIMFPSDHAAVLSVFQIK